MISFPLVALLLTASSADSEPLLRRLVAEVALRQLKGPEPAWHPAQRDCAGLVRFAIRSAYRHLRPARLSTPLFADATGAPSEFADAETLLARSFSLIGRTERVVEELQSADLLAFRQPRTGGEAVFHLMLVVRPPDPAHGPARVVYHPGEPDAAVRQGTLSALFAEAPAEWRPTPTNPAFLGAFRFKEWMR